MNGNGNGNRAVCLSQALRRRRPLRFVLLWRGGVVLGVIPLPKHEKIDIYCDGKFPRSNRDRQGRARQWQGWWRMAFCGGFYDDDSTTWVMVEEALKWLDNAILRDTHVGLIQMVCSGDNGMVVFGEDDTKFTSISIKPCLRIELIFYSFRHDVTQYRAAAHGHQIWTDINYHLKKFRVTCRRKIISVN